MLSEIILIMMVCSISVQASSLISSILLVPSSVALMLTLNVNFFCSGILCYVFIMIFIGGLMVLLVSVSSTVQQEQGIFPSLLIMFSLISIISILMMIVMDWNLGSDSLETSVNLINLLGFLKVSITISMLLLLTICLLVLTKLLLDYKGLTRNL